MAANRAPGVQAWVALALVALAAGAAALVTRSAGLGAWPALAGSALLAGAAAVALGSLRERRREAALHAARDALQHAALWSESNDAIFIHDDGLRVLDANPRACALFGRSREEMAAASVHELVPPEAHAELEAAVAQVRRTGEYLGAVSHRRKDGTSFAAEASVRRVQTSDGRWLTIVAVHDLTARRRVEEDLRRHAALLDSMHDAVIALDHERRIAVWNRAAEGLFGLRAAEAIGRPWAEVVHAERLEPPEPELAAALDRDGAASWRATVRTRDGQLVETEGTTVVVDEHRGGGIAASLSTFRRRGEAELLRTRLAAAARMASIGTLAAGVAHEINNPLAYVLTNLSFVGDALGSRGAAADRELVAAVHEAEEGARRVAAIVSALRTFSRQAPSPELRRPIDACAAARAAARLVEPQVRGRARFTVELAECPPVLADEHELAQVIVHLLVNAVQALPDGGAALHEIALRSRREEGGLALSVHDTGGGIPPGVRARIFEPFFTTRSAAGGTGLGLAVCHGIVESLGGRIEVESTPGRGTTFTVHLPTVDGADATPGPPAAPGQEPRRARILVLDDEPLVASAVARTLARDHEVVATTDPHEALARVMAGDPFDLFLCDLAMPDASGMECHAEVRRIRPELASRMVFLTGGAYTPEARAFLAAVPNRAIEKPFDPASLRAAVAEELGRAPLSAPARAS